MFRFYAPIEGNAHVTSAAVAIAAWIAVNLQKKVVIVKWADPNDSLRRSFYNDKMTEKEQITDRIYGINALKLLSKGKRPDREQLESSVVKTPIPNLDLFPGNDTAEGENRFRKLICDELAKIYEYVFIVTTPASGNHDSGEREICVLPQDIGSWKRYFTQKKAGKPVYIINGYHKNSVSNRKKLNLLFGEQALIIPFKVGFMDALSTGNTARYFEMGRFMGRMNPDSELMDDVKKIAMLLAETGGEY